jgi:hypothetical protein
MAAADIVVTTVSVRVVCDVTIAKTHIDLH